MTVFIVTHQHKHGLLFSAYKTKNKALNGAYQIARDRVCNAWDGSERTEFFATNNPERALVVFHRVEKNTSYGEVIEIVEANLIE